MPLYEFVFLVRQDVSQSQVQSIAEHAKSCIEADGGEVSKIEYCGLRNLAYRIKKNKKAHYVLLNVACQSKVLDELERQMRLHEDVLRYLRVRTEKLDPNPSALVQTKHYRDRNDEEAGAPRKADALHHSPAADATIETATVTTTAAI